MDPKKVLFICCEEKRELEELAILAFIGMAVLLIAVRIEAMETIMELSQNYEHYEVDELVSTFTVFSFIFAVFYFRRWGELKEEIFQRRKFENALEAERDKIREYLDIAGVMLVAIDSDERIAMINRKGCKLLEGTENELIGKNWFDNFIPERVVDNVRTVFRRLMAGEIEVSEHYENPVLTIKGNERIIEWHNTVLRDDVGNIVGTLSSGEDITDRKKMEDAQVKLSEALKMVNKILRHDVLNDLTVMRGSIEMYNEVKDEKLLNNILISIDKSVSLIKQMRELESIATSGEKLYPVLFRDVIDDVIEKYNVNLKIEGECTVYGDVALKSVLDNIIGNAIKHGKADTINIKMSENSDEGTCIIKIEDNGIGIPDEIKEKIFSEQFAYGENKGSGLGLYIASKTIERYGGSINVGDNHPNGVVFTLLMKKAVIENKSSDGE